MIGDRRVRYPDASVACAPFDDEDKQGLIVFRRSSGWVEEVLAGAEAILALPEVGIEIPLAELYR